jgi:dTDP-4-amino-4,6-dideoxygalactose transaminase
MRIPLNRPDVGPVERSYVSDVLDSAELKGGGRYGAACESLMKDSFGGEAVLMTSSCTHALEMAALLLEVGPGDEVVVPAYTFPSTATAFALRGARIRFCDVDPDTLNMDAAQLESVMTDDTTAVVPVHYAGVACDMDAIGAVAHRHEAAVIEDAAQAINASYGGQPLGTIGRLGCYSFHGTKSYAAGEGGALVVNDPSLVERAEILRQKGTNYEQFRRGEVDEYTWVDLGSSYVPSELQSALALAQLERRNEIRKARRVVYEHYYEALESLERTGAIRRPRVPGGRQPNYHLFYLRTDSEAERDALKAHLQDHGIGAASHYRCLHTSQMGRSLGYEAGDFPESEAAESKVLRLPLHPGVTENQRWDVIESIEGFFEQNGG